MEYWRPLLQDTSSFASLLGNFLWTCEAHKRGQCMFFGVMMDTTLDRYQRCQDLAMPGAKHMIG